MADGINVGDAVLTFIGDTTNIDSAFDKVNKGVENIRPISPEVPESAKLTGRALYEARGEARLLGEELGVRLPRHVSNFIAELPGLGSALSAAFSATAVLFLASAVVDLAKKATAFVADNLVFTQAMKDSNAATEEANKILLELAGRYDKAKDSLEKFGAKGTDAMRLQLEANKEQLATLEASRLAGEKNSQNQRVVTNEYITQTGWVSKAYDKIHAMVVGGKTQIENIKAQTTAIQNKVLEDDKSVKALAEENALLEKQLETERKLEEIKSGGESKSAGAKLAAKRAQEEVALDSQTAKNREVIANNLEDTLYQIKLSGMHKQLAILKEDDANTKDAQLRLLGEIKIAAEDQARVIVERLIKAKDELHKTLDDMAKDVHAVGSVDIVTPPAVARMLEMRKAAKDLGITLRSDLQQALNTARLDMDNFVNAGGKDKVVLDEFRKKIEEAEKALNNFGVAEDKFKGKSDNTWKGFQQDMKNGAQAMANLKQMGTEAFDSLAAGMQGAIASAIEGSNSFGRALEQATAKALISLASQALVKALFYTAEGFAAMAGFEEQSAGQYFAAAGLMAAVGGAAAVAGRALSGAGGSSSNTQQSHTSQSNTTQGNRSAGQQVGVQGFADGGLITEPTLAVMGEFKRKEGVLPLEDPRAMSEIAGAINAGGGGGGLHFHLPHGSIISADTMQKFVSKMNRMVDKGQLKVKASDSLRLTRRSS